MSSLNVEDEATPEGMRQTQFRKEVERFGFRYSGRLQPNSEAVATENFDQMTAKTDCRLELRSNEEGGEHLYWHGVENGRKRVWTDDPDTEF